VNSGIVIPLDYDPSLIRCNMGSLYVPDDRRQPELFARSIEPRELGIRRAAPFSIDQRAIVGCAEGSEAESRRVTDRIAHRGERIAGQRESLNIKRLSEQRSRTTEQQVV